MATQLLRRFSFAALVLFVLSCYPSSTGGVVTKTAVWYEFDRFGHKTERHVSYTVPETAFDEDTPRFAPSDERVKRNVYGQDDRIPVQRKKSIDVFPFSSVVNVSTGCSGSFISPNRILTAAHCIWNFGVFKPGVQLMTVSYAKKGEKYKIDPVIRYFIPGAWFDRERSDWEEYDYALLQLNSQAGNVSRRGHLQLGLSVDKDNGPLQQNGIGTLAEMIGYPEDKPNNSSWYVFCNVLGTTKSRLYFECDAAKGMSGSVVYTKEFDCNSTTYVRRAIGVFSGIKYSKEDGREYNVAIRFSQEHYLQMCHVMGIQKECEDRYHYYFYSSSRSLQREHCPELEREHYCQTYANS